MMPNNNSRPSIMNSTLPGDEILKYQNLKPVITTLDSLQLHHQDS